MVSAKLKSECILKSEHSIGHKADISDQVLFTVNVFVLFMLLIDHMLIYMQEVRCDHRRHIVGG